MLLPRLALILALLPGLYALALGLGAAPTAGALAQRAALEQGLAELDAARVGRARLAELARRHGLWAIEIRDRAGQSLAAWQRLPLARSGLLGAPTAWVHPGSGARVLWWSARGGVLGGALPWLGLGWCALMLLALWNLRRPAHALAPQRLPAATTTAAPTLRPRLRVLLDALPGAVVVADAQDRVVRINARLADWLGRNPRELRGLPLSQALPLRDAAAAAGAPPPWRAGEGRLPRGEEAVLEVPGGTRRVNWAAAYAPDGSLALALLDASRPEAEKRESELGLLRHIVDALPVGILVTDAKDRIRLSNRTAARLFAWAPGELEGEAISKLMPVPFLNQPDIQLRDYRARTPQEAAEQPKVVGWRRDATTFPVGLQVEDLTDDSGGLLLIIEDRTEAQQTAAAQSRLGRLFEQTAEEVLILDARSLYVREANRGAQENLGFSLAQLRRMTLFHLAPELDSVATDPQLARLRAGEQRELRLNTLFARQDQTRYPVALSLTCSREEEPPVLMLLAHDVTALRAAESRLAWISGHDGLTRLPNRSAAMEELARAAAELPQAQIALVALDGLRELNLEHGHEQGDVVIASVAERLEAAFPDARLMARWSGAAFVLLLPEPPQGLDAALGTLSQPVELPQATALPAVALGLAPLRGRLEPALAEAARALEEARRGGGGWRGAA